MALPLGISGISTAVACVGPYKSSGGNYYFFGRDNTTATTLQAYKSTAPDIVWSSISTKTGFTTAILVLAGYQVADVIHLLVLDGTMSTSVATKYVSFDMATDTFLTTTETVAAASVITGLATSGWGCSLVVRSTGEVVAFYNGVNTKVTNTYSRIYYQRRTGVNTWSAAVQVDTNTAKDSIQPGAVLAASDVVHFLNFTPTASFVGINQRTLSAANVLQTASTLLPFTLAAGVSPTTQAVSYNNAGTQKIVGTIRIGSTSATTSAVRFDSGNTPTLSSSTIATTSVVPVGIFNDGTNVYALYRHNSDNNLYVVASTDNGATWGTATSIGPIGSTSEALSRCGKIYQRGSNVVFPYMMNNGGILYHNEYIVRSVAAAATAMPPFQSPRKIFAVSGRMR
jgi:hypothetical protein